MGAVRSKCAMCAHCNNYCNAAQSDAADAKNVASRDEDPRSPKNKARSKRNMEKLPEVESEDQPDVSLSVAQSESESMSSEVKDEEPEEVTIHFDANRQWKWGVAVGFGGPVRNWKISNVTIGHQFQKKGVKEGWRILKINDIPLTQENKQSMGNILRTGEACSITMLCTT